MTIEDATRLLRQPQKHYSNSRLQMARVIIDSDFNEGIIAEADEWRAADLHIIGPAASPDQGYYPDLVPGAVTTAKSIDFGALPATSVVDFPIRAGSFYVGGRRFEQLSAESVVFQRAYLQMGPKTAPLARVGTYRQLAILRGWDQVVTAVEDAELIEAALGGADSAVRIRSTARVEIYEVKSQSCPAALGEILAELTENGAATYDPLSGELRSNARLQLGFASFGSPGDCAACSPSLADRYLGSEPHAIRIMLVAADRYVWAYDNAAPLYRVRLILDGARGGRVEFLTPPKDEYHEPGIDTVVELLPWSVLLDPLTADAGNLDSPTPTERIANRIGILAEVDEPYSPAKRSMHVQFSTEALARLGVPTGKTTKAGNLKASSGPARTDVFATHWDSRHPEAAQLNVNDADSATHLYLRIWHTKRSGAEASIATSSRDPLGDTGIVPMFTGRGRAGDYWIATVRPSAPEEILPRELMASGGTPPAGPVEFIAPICLLEWHSERGVNHTLTSIQDCRQRLSAVTQRGCCTYSVGPEMSGDYPTIQAAIDALPREGGRICLLQGTYKETIVVRNRTDVILEGCGALAKLEPAVPRSDDPLAAPAILVEGEGTAVIRELAINARNRVGLQVEGARVRIENVTVNATSWADQPARSAVRIHDAEDVRVASCHLAMDAAFTDHAALYVSGKRIEIEQNVIQTAIDDNGETRAWGGIHVAGGTQAVLVLGNRIEGGRGNGVTLGSVRFRGLDGSVLPPQGAGAGQSLPDSATVVTGQIEPVLRANSSGERVAYFPDPDDAITDLDIRDNRIMRMGGSGIASLAVEVRHKSEALRPPLCIRRTRFDLNRVAIANNDIVQNEQAAQNTKGTRVLGAVVISRATNLRFVSNSVEENATQASQACGVFVAGGASVAVTDNRIRRNGSKSNIDIPAAADRALIAGGVVLGTPASDAEKTMDLGKLIHAATVRGNVIEQANGPALAVFCCGSTDISANTLSSYGPYPISTFAGATVNLLHRERPWEALELPDGEPDPARWVQPRGSGAYLREGAWKEFGDSNPGSARFAGNQITTISRVSLGVPAVLLLSSNDLVVHGNQFSARVSQRGTATHVLAMGATINVNRNRVAENISAVSVSLTVLGVLMMVATENTTTHCTVAYNPNNQGNPSYYQNEDNLVWFTPVDVACSKLAPTTLKPLEKLIERAFGPNGLSFRFSEEYV